MAGAECLFPRCISAIIRGLPIKSVRPPTQFSLCMLSQTGEMRTSPHGQRRESAIFARPYFAAEAVRAISGAGCIVCVPRRRTHGEGNGHCYRVTQSWTAGNFSPFQIRLKLLDSQNLGNCSNQITNWEE